MPSSISSSNERLPRGPWLKTWVMTLALTAAALVAVEAFWRSKGHEPSITDDVDLWCTFREKASEAGQDTICALGASRIQLGFVPSAFREQFPHYRILNLTVNGLHPIAALRDLAEEEAFRGIVICAITAPALLKEHGEDQEGYVRYFHTNWTVNKKLDRTMRTWIQKNVVSTRPFLSLRRILPKLLRGDIPEPSYLLTHPDRWRTADYTAIDIEEARRRKLKRLRKYYQESHRPISSEEWLDSILRVDEMVERIQRRGGTVVFVRFVTSGEHRELDEQYYPRKKFWDVFAERTSAVTIHFEDVPSLRSFICPEGSHLDRTDAIGFTKALAEEMFRRGLITR